MKWYIGQEIVCIKDGPFIKDGDIFTIKALKGGFCECASVLIDVGITGSGESYCSRCRTGDKTGGVTHWFAEQCFAPLEYGSSAIEELLKIQEPQKP